MLLGVILACGILTFLIVRRERTLLLELNRQTSALLAGSITRNLREAMLEKDPAIVIRMLESHNGMDGVKAAVFRNDGSLVYGDMEYQVPSGIVSSPKETSLTLQDHLIFLEPLLNEKKCHACHNSSDNIRGFVAVRISTGRVKRDVDNTAKHMVFFAAITAFLSGTGLIVVLKKMVLSPLVTIRDGSVKIRDGDLGHRIGIESSDELGTLARSFNQMAEKIEHAQKGLEEAVNRKTRELRVIAELSKDVFRGDHTLRDIVEKFLAPITRDFGYAFSALCLFDRETGVIRWEYEHGLDTRLCAGEMTLADSRPFVQLLLQAKPSIRKSGDIGMSHLPGSLAVIPLLSHQKKRCRDINLCTYEGCPAFGHADERCWLIDDTLCRSPHSVKDGEKIYGCLHCEAFPLVGALIAGRSDSVGKSSLHSLEILASEIESAIENYHLMLEKRRDIQNLIRLHDISVESIKSLLLNELSSSIVSVAASFANADASLLWLVKDATTLHIQDSSTGDTRHVPPVLLIEDSFAGKALLEHRPLETINTTEITCMSDFIEAHGFHYAASIPLRGKHATIGCLTLFKRNDFFMTDSEKAIITLFASQAASAINTAKIYAELKDQKEFSDAIFSSTLSGIMVLDRTGTVLRINQAAMEILQISDRTPDRWRITDIYPETGKMLSLGTGPGKEVTITLREGQQKPVGYSNSLLRDKSGSEKGVIVIFRDLTEIKELQNEVRKKQHFEAMGKIISGVAHEVRNPLFAIQSITQILEREIESAQHQTLIKALLKESYRMKNLVEELLLYSRPSRLTIVAVALEPFLAEVAGYLKAREGRTAIRMDIPPSAAVMADRDKLLQVFLNLVNNSLAAGGKSIDIAVRTHRDTVTIVFSDDGTGIREEDLEKIFDPFFTTKREGTGLGLPICKKIVEDHGGTIQLHNAESGGTAAVITLPA